MAPSQKETPNQTIGRSRGGLTTKSSLSLKRLGNLVRFVLLPAQRHDIAGVKSLIETVDFDMVLADKAFDADWLRAELDDRGAIAVIPPKSNRKEKIACDFQAYRWSISSRTAFALSKRCAESRRLRQD